MTRQTQKKKNRNRGSIYISKVVEITRKDEEFEEW